MCVDNVEFKDDEFGAAGSKYGRAWYMVTPSVATDRMYKGIQSV